MARPKLGESETERLHVKITADEIEAIDDWRFAHRAASRSEAIRRLCRIGIYMNTTIPEITDRMSVAIAEARLFLDFSLRAAEAQEAGEKVDTMELVGRAESMLDHLDDLFLLIVRENNRIIPLAERKDLKKAFEAADLSDAEFARIIQAYIEDGDTYRESQIFKRVREQVSTQEWERYRKLPPEKQDAFWQIKIANERKNLAAFKSDEDAEE